MEKCQKWLSAYKSSNVSEIGKDRRKITIENHYDTIAEFNGDSKTEYTSGNQRPWMTLKGYYALFQITCVTVLLTIDF